MEYKYQLNIDTLIKKGIPMPHLHQPNDMAACRFTFMQPNSNCHKPVCIQNPARVLPDNVKMSGYALSCFNNSKKAEKRYLAIRKSFKRAPLVIGDAICEGKLTNDDGMVTEADNDSGHFDLYEFPQCDLSKTFKIKKSLI